MAVQILASKPRQGDVAEVILYDNGLRVTATIDKSMLDSGLLQSLLQSIMDRERERIDRARAITTPEVTP